MSANVYNSTNRRSITDMISNICLTGITVSFEMSLFTRVPRRYLHEVRCLRWFNKQWQLAVLRCLLTSCLPVSVTKRAWQKVTSRAEPELTAAARKIADISKFHIYKLQTCCWCVLALRAGPLLPSCPHSLLLVSTGGWLTTGNILGLKCGMRHGCSNSNTSSNESWSSI